MVAFNFQNQFATLVENGSKQQTIRSPRKRNRKGLCSGQPCRVGEVLQLYVGMRTANCCKLANAECVAVTPIRITQKTDGHCLIYKDKLLLSSSNAKTLAKADGFDNFGKMIDWFQETHGLPFTGFLIEWKLM